VVPTPHDDVGVDDPEPGRTSLQRRYLTETVVPWLRFVGSGRLLGTVGVVLVLAGVAWWLLRSPVVPTESRLPLAQRAEASPAVASEVAVAHPAPASTPAGPEIESVVVHVTGAVQVPGVYELQPGQRVADAIDAAGGALADADAEALNLAARVVDGDRIAVPILGESSALGDDSGHRHAAASIGAAGGTPIDINTAGVAELETLPGIGPATAAAIVEHRDQHGPYATVDDLEAVQGIGPAKIEAIRDHVTA
jgi:competence protein ComEA